MNACCTLNIVLNMGKSGELLDFDIVPGNVFDSTQADLEKKYSCVICRSNHIVRVFQSASPRADALQMGNLIIPHQVSGQHRVDEQQQKAPTIPDVPLRVVPAASSAVAAATSQSQQTQAFNSATPIMLNPNLQVKILVPPAPVAPTLQPSTINHSNLMQTQANQFFAAMDLARQAVVQQQQQQQAAQQQAAQQQAVVQQQQQQAQHHHHQEEAHKSEHVCPVCKKDFSSRTALRRHVQFTHEDQKNHICDLCGKRYGAQSHLRAHKQTKHENVRFQCRLCGKELITNYNLSRHMKAVHQIDASGQMGGNQQVKSEPVDGNSSFSQRFN